MYGVLYLILIYAAPVYFTTVSLISYYQTGSTFKIYSIILMLVAVCAALIKLYKSNYKISTKKAVLICALIYVVIAFWMTQYRYGVVNPSFINAFLNMGVRIVPVMFLGCVITRKDYYSLVRFVPVIVFLFTFSVYVCIQRDGGLGQGNQRYNDAINTYQELAYYISYAYCLSLSWMLFGKGKRALEKIVTIIMLCMVPVQLFSLLTLGGKGAIISAGVSTCILAVYHPNIRKWSPFLLVVGCVIGLCRIPYLAMLPGVYRFLNMFADASTSTRFILWQKAFEAGWNKLIVGNGVGSIFYIVGFPSHNIFLDWFAEYGLLGFLVCICLLGIAFYKMHQVVQYDTKYMIIGIMFINAFIMSVVSGYYLGDPALLGIVAHIFCMDGGKKVNGDTNTWQKE